MLFIANCRKRNTICQVIAKDLHLEYTLCKSYFTLMKHIKDNKDDYFVVLLHKSGLKATMARIATLRVLEKNHKPLSIGILQKKTGAKKVDTVTLYRMMQSFQEKGIVRRVDLRHTHAHYELATRADHHHITCEMCGKIEDIPWCDLAPIVKKALCQSSAFSKITDHTFELFGVCNACADKK